MTLTYFQLPDISQYMEYVHSIQINNNITIVFVFKQLFRSDDVIVDIYLNEITEDSIILSGRKIEKESILCLPNSVLNFNYSIYCVNIDDINAQLTKNNLHKFYLQLDSTIDGEL